MSVKVPCLVQGRGVTHPEVDVHVPAISNLICDGELAVKAVMLNLELSHQREGNETHLVGFMELLEETLPPGRRNIDHVRRDSRKKYRKQRNA
jgi:hypothetical protein